VGAPIWVGMISAVVLRVGAVMLRHCNIIMVKVVKRWDVERFGSNTSKQEIG
jgi:hypothetical protein